jgi:hypothetical protein
MLLALAFVVLMCGLVLAWWGVVAEVASAQTVVWTTIVLFGVLFCTGLLLGSLHTPRPLDQHRFYRRNL